MRIALLLFLLIGNVAGAQATFPVTVHVTDVTGALVTSASVSAKGHDETWVPVVRADAHGDAVLQLAPGTYTVRVTSPGFATIIWKQVSVSGATALSVVLRPGSVGNAPVINVRPDIPTETLPRDSLIPLISLPPCRCMRAQRRSRQRADGSSSRVLSQ